MKRELDRAKSLKKLFDRQKEKLDPQHRDPDGAAARAMDRLVGPEWRVEIQVPGLKVIDAGALAAPSGDSPEIADGRASDAFYKRVRGAVAEDLGAHPDSVEFDEGQPNPERRVARGLAGIQARVRALLASMGMC